MEKKMFKIELKETNGEYGQRSEFQVQISLTQEQFNELVRQITIVITAEKDAK